MKFNNIRFVKSEQQMNQWIKIDLTQVTYIEASNNKSIIYFENGNSIACKSSLYKVQSVLPFGFERIHRTYIVNMAFVNYIKADLKIINLNNKVDITYGLSYKENIQRYFISFNKNIFV